MKRVRVAGEYGRVQIWVDGKLAIDETCVKTDGRSLDLYRRIASVIEERLASTKSGLASAK